MPTVFRVLPVRHVREQGTLPQQRALGNPTGSITPAMLDRAYVENQGTAPGLSSGTDAAKPAAGTAGRLYVASDTRRIYRDSGAAWVEVARWPGNIGAGDLGFDPATQAELDTHAALSGLSGHIPAAGITDAHVAAANKDGAAATASMRTIGGGAQQAAAGNHNHDAAYAALVHKTRHEPGGADALTALTHDSVAAANKDGVAGTPSMRTLGSGGQQAAAGNHNHDGSYAPTSRAAIVASSGSGVFASALRVHPVSAFAAAGGELRTRFYCPAAGSISNLRVICSGAGNFTVTVYKNGVATALALSFNNEPDTLKNDADSVAVAAGDYLELDVAITTGSGGNGSWSFEYKQS